MTPSNTKKMQAALVRLLPLALLAAAALLACAPFLGGGLYHGSDLGYHLRRIENIAIGLSRGVFPVRVQSDWLSGYGYAVGVFYGDALLYFPAALRLVGLPVTWCYGLYLLGVTLLTAWGGYWCGRRLGAPRTAALAGAALYTLSAYRLCDVTTRAALGEYTALAFLPLVACGFWQTLCPPAAARQPASRLPGWGLLVLGLSGVLQSHLLSFEMTVLCLCAAALVLARYTFRKAALARLCGAAGAFCLLNAGYLVPLFDYYFTGKFQINQPGGTEAIQANGALWGQLLGLPYAATGPQQADLVQNMALTPGTALLLGAALALGLAVVALVRRRGGLLPLLCLGASALLVWMSSNTFPWDALYALGGAAQSTVGSLQFPWRFLGPATLFLALGLGAGLALLPHRALRAGLGAALCLLGAWAARDQLAAYAASAAPESYFCGTEEPFWEKTCGHYLPAENGAVALNDLPTGPVWDDGITLGSYAKGGTTITFAAQNTSDVTASVRLPLLWYKGYTADNIDASGSAPAVTCGRNNSVTVQLPAGYSGTVQVSYQEPWSWRAAELASALAAVAALALLLRRRRAK